MTKLLIMSDLHVEKGDFIPPPIDADLVVLAGDIGWGLDGVAWIARHLGGCPAVYVAGNREHWHHPQGCDPAAEIRRAAAEIPNLHFLQNDTLVLDLPGGPIRVLGCTLWGDFSLDGTPEASMACAAETMPDYKHGNAPDGSRLTPADTVAANRASVAFLTEALRRHDPRPTIVVTHHVPSERSLPRRKPGNVPQAASVTHLDTLVAAHGPDLWIHGHTHADCDYHIGRTRVLSRQRGGPDCVDFEPLSLVA
ncbi:MAG: metallophosphoesterase [Actinomycetota bacterium]